MLPFLLTTCLTAAITPVPDLVPAAVPDVQEAQVSDRVQLTGMVGMRIQASALNRLLEMDVGRLLEGYRKRPGRQTWDGEHVGKWLHAASLAWANTGDARLHDKIARAVTLLVACQQEDGYLGTYLPALRWTEWDVWAHKYNLIGLITWMRLSGDPSAQPCRRAMADLLCREFGDGKRDLNGAGWHEGLAPGSVLEPMVWMYRFTGDERYRDRSAWSACASSVARKRRCAAAGLLLVPAAGRVRTVKGKRAASLRPLDAQRENSHFRGHLRKAALVFTRILPAEAFGDRTGVVRRPTAALD